MPLLQRITSPINALLPDISRVPQRRQAVGAIVASLVVHLILLLLFVAVAGFLPGVNHALDNPVPELQPLEVQIVPPAEEKPVTPEELKAAAEPPVIDSTGLAKATEPPKDAIFQSDQDMKAGSEKPATGDVPLPSQDGRELPFTMFKNQDVMLGSPKLPPSEAAPTLVPAPPSRATQPKPPEPKIAENKPAPEPPPTKPEPTPKNPEVPELKDDQIAIAQKTTEAPPIPMPRLAVPDLAPRPLPEANETKPDRKEMAKLVTPSPKNSRRNPSGFQEEQTQTRVEGSISNRGPKGVDAVKTPLGAYLKQVKAQIGSRWFYYMKQRRDLFATGSAKISFVITKEGKVREVRVVDNTSNEAFALMCQQCITEAEITPPPDEAAPVMPNGQLEHDFTFNYVPIQ